MSLLLTGVGRIASAAAASDPSGIFSTNLVLWLKADAGINGGSPTNGDAVGTWTDQSTYANNASQSTTGQKPAWRSSVINGLPAVETVVATNNWLQITNSASLQPGSGSWTVFVVGKMLTYGSGDFPQIIGSRPWNAGADLGWAVCFNGANGFVGVHFADGSNGWDVGANISATAFSTSAFQAWENKIDRTGAVNEYYKSGTLDAQRAPAVFPGAINQTNTVYIGRDVEGANSRQTNMQIAEIFVINRILTAGERTSVQSYINGRYAI